MPYLERLQLDASAAEFMQATPTLKRSEVPRRHGENWTYI